MKNVGLLLTLVLFACSSTTTSLTGRPPGKDGKRRGTVVYNPNGIAELVEQRRKSAIGRIEDYCGVGGYKIIKEKHGKIEDRSGVHQESVALIGATSVLFIDFVCHK